MSDYFPHLIVIEGPDGVGKSTQARAVSDALAAGGIASRPWRHQPPPAYSSPWRAALHYAAERAAFVEGLMACDIPNAVVCDRWWQTNYVEGAALHHDGIKRLAQGEAVSLPLSLVLFLLDAPDAVLDARMRARGETPTRADTERRWQYREAVTLCVRVDASGPIAEVTAEILGHLSRAFGRELRVVSGALAPAGSRGVDADGREVSGG